jgi:ABC-type nitrate/sulfonate/bicarbonate transport system permease component
MIKKMKDILRFSVPIILLLVVWELYSRYLTINSNLFPPPSIVFYTLFKLLKEGVIFNDILISLYRLFLGLILGSFVGILTGLLTGTYKNLSAIFSPIAQTFKQFPPVAIVPFMIVWFGIDDFSKIISIAFAVFFPVWMNTHTGVTHIPDIFVLSAKQFTSSRLILFKKIIFPGSLPFIMSGLRTSISVAFVMIFVSELAGASSGLGYQMSVSQLSYRMDQMMAILFIFGIIGALTDFLFVNLTKITFPWIKNLNK